MALDPLRFAIEIADEASQKIKAIKEELNKLEPKIKVTFDESSINVAQLRTALENAIKSLGEIKVSGAGINISGDALGGAADKINEAKEAIKGGRFGELAKRINEATTELERLTNAFETFQLTIGKDKGLKDFMTGLGEVISNVKTQLGALDKVSNSETSLTKSSEKIETNRRKFNELIEAAGKLRTELVSVDSAALNLNMDNPSMRNSIKVINDFIAKLRELRENGGVNFTNNHAVNELIAQFTRLKSALTDVSSEQQRLNKSVSAEGARDDAAAAKEARQNYEAWVESIRRATVEHTKLAITIAQLEDKERKASATGVDTKDLKDQIAGLKQYKDTLKEIADGQKQHGLAKDFIRRADVESAIMLAKREGEVVMQNTRAREQSDKQMLQNIKQADDNQQRFNKVLAEAVAMQERLANAGNKGTHLALDTAKVDEASVKVQQYIDKLLVLDQTQFGSAEKAEWKTIEAGLKAAAVAQEKLNKATEQQQEKDRNRAIKQQAKDAADAAKETEKWAKSQNQARIEANELKQTMRELKAAMKTGNKMGIDTTELERNMAVMQRYLNKLFAIANGVQKFGHTGDFLGEAPFKIAAFNADKAATNINRLAGDAQKAASATSQLTAEEQRLAQALNQTTEHARGQSQVLSDLKSMAMQYLGVWGGQQFLHNIIEIGGQLEMQRLSIGAILQNQGQANELFDKIKGLAVQSPFGVVELDQMTKQLTAYGFKYNELFDMTKRLADISAATGTGVDRLALALGHVRSEAALSGYTLRQFSMANVPLLQKLSEKLGKTTQEIRKMVRSKEISYEDVIGVLQDITNEGGMFYNMQEVISQSVKAKFKNVKDAMDIMYGEMAESGIGGLLKDVALLLMELTKNWKTVGAAVTGAVAPMVLYKAAMWATSKAVSANVAYTGQFTAKQLEAQAITGNLSKKLLLQAVASGKLSVANAEAAAATLGLTRAQLQWVARSGNVAAATNKATLATSKFTVAQLRSLAVARDSSYSFMTRNLARLKFGLGVAGNAAKAFGDTLAGLARSFLPLAAISAVFAMISRSVEASSKAQETAKDIAENARDTQKSINSIIQEQADDKLLKSIEKSKFSVNGRYVVQNAIEFDDDALAKTNLTERIKQLREELQNLSPLYSGDIIDINEAETQVEQYKVIVNKLESLRHVNDVNEATSNVLPNANKRVQGGNWFTRMFGDNFTTDLTDYSNRMEDSVEEINQISEVELDKIDKVLKGKLSKLQSDLNLSSLGEALKLYFLNGKRELEKGSTDFNEELYKVINSNGDKQTLKDYYDSFFDPVTFGRSLHSQRSQVLGETKKMSQAIASTISTYFKDDPDGAVYALKGFFDRMFSEAGVTDNSVMQEAINRILDDMREMSDKSVQAVADEFQRKQVMIQFSNLINPGEIEGAKTEKELDALFQKYLGKIQEWAKILGIDLEKLGLGSGGKFFGGFKKAFNAAKNTDAMLKDWQKRAGKVFELNTEIKVKSKTVTDMDEFAQAVQKDLKEKQEYITRNASHIKHTLTINAGIKFNMDKLDTKALNDMIIELGTKVQVLLQQGKIEAAKSLNSIIQDELIPFRDVLASIDENKKWLKSEGYPEKDPTKGKSKNKNTGSKEDKNAKAVRERVRILKEAADAFEYWNKKLGPTGAWERVNEQFGDVLSKIGVTIDNIEDLRGNLKAVANSKEYKAIKDQKVKLEIDKEIAKDLDQLNRKVFEKSIDEYKSKFTKTLDDLTRRWETFNAVRQATGSKAIALDIAGISEQDRGLRNAADAMRRKLVEEMRNAGGDSIVTAIPLDVYIDEEKLRDQFKSALGDNDEQAMKIDGLVEAYKRWQKAQQDVTKADIDAYAKIIGSVVDYTSRIGRINDKLEQEKENIEALVALYNKSGGREGISQDDADTAIAILMAKANFDKLKEGSDYINLMNRSLSMTKGEVTAAASAIEDSLNERLAAGVIKAEEYATEMKKLHDIVAKFDENSLFGSNSALTSFLSGGLKGSQSFVNDRIVSLTIKSNQEGLSEDEQNELDGLIELRKKLDSAISKLSGFAAALQVVTGALDGFHKAAQSLSEMFDALGKEGPASFWGDIADGISAVSSIFEPANNLVQNALSGNIGGVLSSAISAPVDMITGPITAFAKLHDKRLERAIERLREDVKSIEANTELIVRSRERTLGYDMGDVRRQMAQQYATPSYKGGGIAALIAAALGGSQQNKSMYDYYMNNSQGTGYEQEYANLVEQREKYMEILKDQQDKKKKSNEEIEETKSKIAELDDQIMNFSQDLAKELWGIDIKGWADQLSDALASAFENGENMAKAYRDTVTSILQQMMQKMMQMQILEPMFANLQKDLFGENGKGGVFDFDNPQSSMSKVTKVIGDFFGKGGEGEKAITASMELMTAFQKGMQDAGLTVLKEASNTLSSGIQGTSEETSGLLAGYVNALRQDVSVNRILLTQYVTQLWPQYIEAYTAQVTSVSNIDNNVRVIMEMMQLGNGAMYEQIAAMRSRIDNIVLGIDSISIR